jgi:hypothetical protein
LLRRTCRLLRELGERLTVSVYVDDIALSGNNWRALERAYRKLTKTVEGSGFKINTAKSAAPGTVMDLFNCHLQRMRTVVSDARQAEFYASARNAASIEGFESYCATVRSGNADA